MINENKTKNKVMSKLVEYLAIETTENLKRRLVGLQFSGPKYLKKQELINLVDDLLQTEKLKTYWEKLSDVGKKAIAEVVFSPDGRFNSAQFFAKYQINPEFSRKTEGRYSCYPELTLLGALFFRMYMPADLRERFKSFVVPPLKSTLTGFAELSVTPGMQIRNMEIAALAEIKTILRLIDQHQLKISDATRYPSTAAMQAVDEVLYDGDFYSEEKQEETDAGRHYYRQEIGYIRAFAWLMLVQAGKLANLSGNYLKLTPAGRKALMQPPAEILKELWQEWLDTNILDEFRRIDVIKGQTGKGKRDFNNAEERRYVIQVALGYVPPNVWITFDAFSRFMLSERITFDVTKGDPWGLYICDPQYGSLGYAGYHDWNILQERYLLCFLFEFAATLGLIDVAYVSPHQARSDYRDMWGTDDLSFLSRYDGLLHFRVNNLGKFCLGIDEQYIATKPIAEIDGISKINNTNAIGQVAGTTKVAKTVDATQMQVDTNGEVTVASPNVSPDIVIILEQFCVRQNKKNKNDIEDSKGRNSWLLNKESLVNALELGYELSQLRALFSQYNTYLPQNIEILFKELESKCDQIKIKGRVVLFECSLPETAKYLAGDSSINRYCSLVAERLLAVPEEKLAKFSAALKNSGYSIRN